MNEKEQLYLDAKEAYYAGSPFMTDSEFDELEEDLKAEGSSVTSIVGANSKGDKFKHFTPMKSLQKIQFKQDYEPLDEFYSFVSKIKEIAPGSILEFTPKFDGNACNLIYVDGKLERAISRGDGTYGQDLTQKIKNIVPQKISLKGNVEVRGELLMKTSIFNEHYSDFKNPRNLVAGILAHDTPNYTDLDRLTFMAFELRIVDLRKDGNHVYDFPTNSTQVLKDLGFNTDTLFAITIGISNQRDSVDAALRYVFEDFTEYRGRSEFLLDGFVCKTQEAYRLTLGENSHHPKWAMAIKFPPKSAVTKVVDVEWNLGKTGYLTPVGILEPVDLDGSTVTRVTLHNYEWITTKKVAPGAVVEIVKSGDIIPAIVNVITESTEDFEVPGEYAGHPVTIKDGKHLVVEGVETLSEFGANKLHKGISILDLQYIGPAMSVRLYDAGITTIQKLWDPVLMTEEYLIENGDFKKGRELQRLLDEIDSFKEVELWKLIHALQFDRVGGSLSKQVAFYMAGQTPDWSGFEKAVVAEFIDIDSKYRTLIDAFVDKMIRNGVKVIQPQVKSADEVAVIYEMTGSPKEFGFKTKADFTNMMKEKGFEHGKLNADCKYLITDSLESSSSKMKKGEKLGVEIKLYSDFI